MEWGKPQGIFFKINLYTKKIILLANIKEIVSFLYHPQFSSISFAGLLQAAQSQASLIALSNKKQLAVTTIATHFLSIFILESTVGVLLEIKSDASQKHPFLIIIYSAYLPLLEDKFK